MGTIKSIIEKLRRISIVWQITIAFTLAMIVPTVIVSISYYHSLLNASISQATSQLEADLLYFSSAVDQNAEVGIDFLDQLYFRQEFSYILDGSNELSEYEINNYLGSMQEEMLTTRNTHPNFFSMIAAYSSNKQIDANGTWSFSFDDLKNTSYFDEAVSDDDGSNFVGNVRKREIELELPILASPADEGGLILPIYRKVNNLRTRETIGLLEVNIPIAKLMNDARLLDQDQSVSYLLYDSSESPIYRTGAKLDINDNFLKYESEGTKNVLKVNGKKYLIAQGHSDLTNLNFVTAMDYDVVIAGTKQMLSAFIIISGLAIGAIFLLSYLSARLLLRKLKEMDQSMQVISSGNFDVQMNESGFNEISRIARTFNSMSSQLSSLLARLVDQEKIKNNAELRALQAQINPHFLHNTIENMRMQCEVDEYYMMGDSLESLSNLLQYSIDWEGDTVTIAHEWANLTNYINIMHMRFGEHLNCELSYDENLRDVLVPKFLLQPLVENSFNHGFEQKMPPWNLFVDICQEDDFVKIVVWDNGIGINSERLEIINQCLLDEESIPNTRRKRRSIGLINVSQRIKMMCLEGSRLEIESDDAGTVVTIYIRI
ncbi:MAG: histidine kinase [Clostridiales Family XIII bacterium]|jgi:two-component system sensor histidine kinase YesM|nr:histidine kinase [Clostridiales Family XIII bacterium]